MRSYFIRRLLLIPPTLIGATLIVFAITRFVPGGPVDRYLAAARQVSEDGGGGGPGAGDGSGISEEQKLQLNRLYLFDQPTLPAYGMWLGVLPREYWQKDVKFGDGAFRAVARTRGPREEVTVLRKEDNSGFTVLNPDGSENTEWLVRATTQLEFEDEHWSKVVAFGEAEMKKVVTGPQSRNQLTVVRKADGTGFEVQDAEGKANPEWLFREATAGELENYKEEARARMANAAPESEKGAEPNGAAAEGEAGDEGGVPDEQVGVDVDTLEVEAAAVLYPRKSRAVLYRTKFQGLITGYLGQSSRYNEPVWNLIVERLPIATYYGLMILIITYVTSVPLGVLKAMKHRTWVDNWTSIFVFVGYAIPGYALAAVLMTYLGMRFGWFPPGGFTGLNFDELGFFGKVWDVLYHSVLPLTCYVIGGFAFLTLMMKNHLMDNMAADYVRTAVAKGVPFKRAVQHHAFRNSLIPIATNLGHQVGLFLTGSFLIERIFDINGIGLLGFESLIDRDYPVVMGILVISALLMMLGNILSDVFVALVDPRVRFK